MRMIMAVVPRDQANHVMEALIAAGYKATFTDSRGGMLRQAQQMLFVAVRQKDLESVLAIIRDNCHTQIVPQTAAQTATQTASESEEDPASMGLMAGLSRAPATYIGSAVVFVWDIERFETY